MPSVRSTWPEPPWLVDANRDARLEEGYRRQHKARVQRTARSGIVGWKIGGNDVGTRARWDIKTCVYGYLPADTCHSAERAFDIAAFSCAAVEPELWIEITRDLDDPSNADEIASCIGRVGLAAELIDVAGRFDDVATVIANNIFHAQAVFSTAGIAFDPRRIPATLITASRNDQAIWRDFPVGVLLPDVRAVVSFIGASLALDGERQRAGQRIMSGVLTPLPVWVQPGDQVRIGGTGLAAVTLTFDPRSSA